MNSDKVKATKTINQQFVGSYFHEMYKYLK